MKSSTRLTIKKVAIVLFAVFVLFYFLPVPCSFKVPLPETVLALAGFFVLPLPMAFAALFSAAGDWFGSGTFNIFELQMGFFALAHVCMIYFFLKLGFDKKREAAIRARMEAKKKGKKGSETLSKQEKWFGTEQQRESKGKWGATYTAGTFILAMLLIYMLTNNIVPAINNFVISRGVLVYGCLIVIMMWAALQQKDWMYGVGAVLFVISDSVLAFDKFVVDIPHASAIILATYYGAQILLFLRSARHREKSVTLKLA